MLYIFHWDCIGHLFYLFGQTCAYYVKVGTFQTGSVAILNFKMEVCLHPVHHIGILFSYYFTIFMSTWYLEFQSKLDSARYRPIYHFFP